MQPNWGDTYAPVGKLTTFRYLISMAASHDLAIDHLDVVTAFPNPEVDDPDLYMEATVGWGDGNHGSEITAGTVVRLKKALYGLKQAPRLWYGDINNSLLSLGFTQSKANPNLYIFGGTTSIGDRPLILLLLYVDDISMAYPRNAAAAVKDIKAKLVAKYKITILGSVRQFLGIELQRGGDVHVGLDLAESHGEREVDPKDYQIIVGSLMYIALATRPDISYEVSALSRYNSRPFTSHLTAAKRTGYTDSDWANDSKDCKSQGGHVFIVSGGAVSWQSRKQDLVAASTLEAEYIACSEASREARWLQQLQRDIEDQPEG